jgi:DNA-binding MarR family transcriptional regulator
VVRVSWTEPEVAEERDRDADAVWWQYQHAHATGLSTSGMTRVTDRLRELGLLTKERVPEDRRGFAATLTECGQQRLEKASVTHRAATDRHFPSRLDDVPQP